MIHWWWLLVMFPVAFWAGVRFCAGLKQRVFKENRELTVEVDRLKQRIQMIGERKLDGTLEQRGDR